MLSNLIIHSVILIISYLVFHRKYDKIGIFGVDVFRWIYYAIELKLNSYRWPSKINGYLDKKPLNYPPVYIYLLSLFPKKIIENKPHYLQQLLFIFEYVSIILFLYPLSNGDSVKVIVLAIGFASFSYKKYHYLSSRPLGYLITGLIIISLNFEEVDTNFLLLYQSILFVLLLLSHRFSLQYIWVSLFLLVLIQPKSGIINAIGLLTASQFLLLIFSKTYRKVFLNHYSILSFYFEKINIDKNWSLKTPKLLYRQARNNILYSIPFSFHVIISLVLNDSPLSINGYLILIGVIYSFVLNVSLFRFWGEPNRVLDYLIIPLLIDIVSLKLEYIVLVCGLILLQFIITSYLKKSKEGLHNVESMKMNIELIRFLREHYGNKQFKFMSYPAVFDDYVKLKFPLSQVFFHDNGLALKYNEYQYKPEFVDIEVEKEYLLKLHQNLGIECFLIHKKYIELVEYLENNYPNKFNRIETKNTALQHYIISRV